MLTIPNLEEWIIQNLCSLHITFTSSIDGMYRYAQWIGKVKISVVEILSGLSHIQEKVEYSITSEESSLSSSIIDMKLVSANSMIFAILERASKIMN